VSEQLDPARWRDVCADDDLAPGHMVNVDLGRHSILLVRSPDGVVAALQNVCPHERCYLHEGRLEDGAIVCGGHGWRFDARTGFGIQPRSAKLGCYEVRVGDGRIYVSLPTR
jgi:toluene monooxygenase system ferredoxin subunit